jgi:hypothetical protein
MRVTNRLQFRLRSSGFAIVLSILLAASTDFGQSPVAEDSEASLQHIRAKVTQQLSRLPNYTCHEAIDRVVQWLSGSGKIYRDRVDLEVAFVGNRELFAYSGQSQFQDQSIRSLVPTGTIGNGVFASHAKILFLGDAAVFHYVGITKKDHHKAYRYDFEVPPEKSVFLVRRDSAQSIVGYRGSIWADVDTSDLVRIEIRADRIPANVGFRFVAERIRYTTVRIRESDVVMADSAEIETYDNSGVHTVDAFTLENCREYTAESSVKFGTPVDSDSKDAGDNSKGAADRDAKGGDEPVQRER